MESKYFEKVEDRSLISDLENEWRNSLICPNDDYWEHLLDCCQYWVLKQENEKIAYACINKNNVLLQFFVSAKWLNKGKILLENFIKERDIKKALPSTNNPIFHSLSMHFQKSVEVDGYLFSDMAEVVLTEKKGEFKTATTDDLERLVHFSHIVLDAPKDWLTNYISNWISRKEFFFLERNDEIIGTCEARTTEINSDFSSLGIVVSPEYRKQGIGSYLLGRAKNTAKERGKKPICSCGKENIGSLKVIENNGFRILHLILVLNFD